MKEKRKSKFKIWMLIIFSSIFLSVFAISLINIIFWEKDNIENEKTLEEIKEIVTVDTKEDNEQTELVNKPLDNNSDYWYYTTFPLIDVDITELKKKNSDTIGWINVNNTNINYPIVQYTDNDFYLHHSFNKTQNEAGWIYLDYRNNNDFSNRNNIIYGHYRKDMTMFATLLNALNYNWYTNKDNHIIRISTEKENTLWQIISVYKTPVESYYITTNFVNDNAYLEFLNTIKERSIHNFNTETNEQDKILTLSTCYSDEIRMVVHAKLLKKETKIN